MENKALEHSMDLALEDSKNAVYATQGGYGYHVAPHAQGHPAQNMPNSECKFQLNVVIYRNVKVAIPQPTAMPFTEIICSFFSSFIVNLR